MVNPLTAADLRKDHLLFVLKIFRYEHQDGMPDRLFGRVAKDLFCRFVPAGYDSVERLTCDRIVGLFNERLQPYQNRSLVSFQPTDPYAQFLLSTTSMILYWLLES